MTAFDHRRSPAERGDYWVAVHTWVFDLGLSHVALCTYIALASFADRAGKAWPSIAAIARRVSLSPRSIQRGLSELEEAGLVRRAPQVKDRTQQSNVYWVRIVAPPEQALEPDVEVMMADGSTGFVDAPATPRHPDAPPCHPDAPPCHTDTPPCHTDVQNTSIEHLHRTPIESPSVGGHLGLVQQRAEARPTTDEAKPKRRGTRIPDDFAVTSEMATWAAQNVPLVDTASETDRFRDYWAGVSGQRGTKLDWVATWRNWMRRADDDRTRGRRSQAQIMRDNAAAAIANDQRAALTAPDALTGFLEGGQPWE